MMPNGRDGHIRRVAPDHLAIDFEGPAVDARQIAIRFDLDGQQLEIEGQWHMDGRLLRPVAKDAPQVTHLLTHLRKKQHLDLCRGPVEANDRTGFEQLSFIPTNLDSPEDEQLDTSCMFLGRRFKWPIMITGMTGGVSEGERINHRLGALAQKCGIPMGVGSQRIAIEHPTYQSIFQLKDRFPDVFLIGNLGFAQLRSADAVDHCRQAVEMIDADALAIHFNLIQESVQVEGDRSFHGILHRLETVCSTLGRPVIVKEVGSGFTPEDAGRLLECGVAAIDVGGKGGTSWGYIEGLRSGDPVREQLGNAFRDWGIPTAHSLALIKDRFPHATVSATGGIRTGLDVAKAVGLGAAMVGVGLPFMRAALGSEHAVQRQFDALGEGLRITMLATGARRLEDLAPRLAYGQPLQTAFEDLMQRRGRL